MKSNRTLAAGLWLAAVLAMPWASAAQFVVKDVSKTIITCDSPLLQALPAGACIGYGPKSLLVTITTAPGEFELRCFGQYCAPAYDTDVVAFHRGRFYRYAENGWPKWQRLPADVENAPPTLSWHALFPNLGSDGKVIYADTFPLYLDDSYDGYLPAGLPLAELEIYVVLSPVGKKLFTAEHVKKIWPLPE